MIRICSCTLSLWCGVVVCALEIEILPVHGKWRTARTRQNTVWQNNCGLQIFRLCYSWSYVCVVCSLFRFLVCLALLLLLLLLLLFSSCCCCCCFSVHWKTTVAAIAVAVRSSIHCRQQKTTFPYTSIELAGWLTEWLCSGQRLNVTAIKTKWHWNTHKNFNQLFMQNNRCLNRFKLIKKSEGGFERRECRGSTRKQNKIVCKSEEKCAILMRFVTKFTAMWKVFFLVSSTVGRGVYFSSLFEAFTKWQKNSLSSLWQRRRLEKRRQNNNNNNLRALNILCHIKSLFLFSFKTRDSLYGVSKNGVRKSGVY